MNYAREAKIERSAADALQATTVSWRRCLHAGCQGAQLGSDDKCLAHTDQRRSVLEVLHAEGRLDARGVHFTAQLLQEILTAARTKDGRPHFGAHAIFTQARFGDGAGFSGAVFDDRANFSGCWFGDGAGFSGAIFGDRAGFSGAIFGDRADFSRASFGDRADFSGTSFRDYAVFREVRFGERTDFSKAVFGDRADFFKAAFGAYAGFIEAGFGNGTLFREATLGKGALFRKARFDDEASFREASFEESASFAEAAFGNDAVLFAVSFGDGTDFGGTVFGDRADFSGAVFGERTNFIRAKFGAESVFGPLLASGDLRLDSAQFASVTRIEIDACRISCTGLKLTAGAPVFRLRRAEVDFTSVDFGKPTVVSRLPSEAIPNKARESPNRAFRDGPARPKIISLRRANVESLVLVDIDLTPCRFAGVQNLDKIRLEGNSSLGVPPRGWQRRGLAWWRWTRRATLAEEHLWRAGVAHARSEGWGSDDSNIIPQAGLAKDSTYLEPRQIASLYRDLCAAHRHDEPLAASFYYGQMDMRRASASGAERMVLYWYWLLCGYGLRPLRALLALLAALVLSSGLIAAVGFPSSQRSSFPARLANSWWASLEAAIFRSAEVELAPIGEHILLSVRVTGPILIGFALLSMRRWIKR